MQESSWTSFAIVFATFVGPIAAVQAQKWVELARERRRRKEWILHALMGFRAARLSAEFVHALNMIDLAFYGRRMFWKTWRSQGEERVLKAWGDYHAHLNSQVNEENQDEVARFNATVDERVATLLDVVAKSLGYEFDRETLRSGYNTRAQGVKENHEALIRAGLAAIVRGEASVPITNVVREGNGLRQMKISDLQ